MRLVWIAGCVTAAAAVAAHVSQRAAAEAVRPPADVRPSASDVSRAVTPRAQKVSLPLVFESNRGQAPCGWDFLVRCRGYHAFVASNSIVFAFDAAALSMTVEGAAPCAPETAGLELPGRSNYLLGNDASKWVTNVPQYRGARYGNLAGGGAWSVGGNGRELEFAFDVAPGAAPPRLTLDGATRVTIDARGDLRVEMPRGVATISAPVAWQEVGDGARSVPARWTLGADGSATVALEGRDRRSPVRVDPTVAYATYLGGSSDDDPTGAAVDSSGSVYLCGATASPAFPSTAESYDPSQNGSYDAFVAKFAPAGTSLVYATFLGTAGDERPHGIALDPSGAVCVSGSTTSGSFPTTPGAYAVTKSGPTGVGFLTRVAASGASLDFSTFVNQVGGLYSPLIDSSGAVLVHNFNRWVFKFNPTLSATIWDKNYSLGSSTIRGACLDADDDIYLAGVAGSGFATTAGAFDGTLGGTSDAFLMKVNSSGDLLFATLLGGTSVEEGLSVGVNLAKQAYVAGHTQSTNFPTTADALQTSSSGGQTPFLTRFNATGTAPRYSTFIRGSSGIGTASSVAVHPTGSCVVGGYTGATSGFPLLNAWQSTSGGGSDAYAAKFERDGTLAWCSYAGGSGSELVTDLGMSANGSVGLGIRTNSTNFPTSAAYQSSLVAFDDAAVVLVPDSLTTTLTVPAIDGTSLPDWTVGIPFTRQFALSGGLAPYAWTLASGTLPQGLTFSAAGLLSGTPTQSGDFAIAVRVTDSCDLVAADGPFAFRVNATPAVTSVSLPAWTRDVAFDRTLAASGGTGGLVFEPVSGALPPGVLMTGSGRVTGTPESAGDFAFTVRVTDAVGATSTAAVTWHVNERLDVPSAPALEWTESRPYSRTFAVTGGTGALAWSLAAGALPVDGGIGGASGTISGTTRGSGDYDFTLSVSDSVGAVASREFSMKVNPTPQFVTQSMPLAFQGRPFSVTLEGTGGTPPLGFALDSSVGAGTMPAGIGLVNGRVFGTPVRPERTLPTVTYTDITGAVARRAFAFEVAGRLDLAAKKTKESLSLAGGASFKRYLELLEGTTLGATLKLKGKGVFGADLTLTAPDGGLVDLSAVRKTTPKSVTISKLPVPATGRYVLAIVRAPDSDGQAALTVSIAPRSAWPGGGAVTTEQETEFAFWAPPGATATIVARPAKGSAALPRIVEVVDDDGADAAAGATAKEHGRSASVTISTPLAGGRYRVRFAARDASAGDIVWSVALKLPRTYDFALPGLGAGDGR